MRHLKDGFNTVRARPWLWISIAVAAASSVTLTAPLATALPLLVDEEFGGNVRVFALLNALSAAGAVAASIWLGRLPRLRRRGPLTYGCWLVASLAAALMGLPVGVAGVAVAILIVGAAESGVVLAWMNVLQEKVPRERLGRVASIDILGSWALLPLGYAAAGLAADAVGAAPVFLFGGLLSAVIVAVGFLHPAVRNLD